MKNFLTAFHILLLLAVIAATFTNLNEMFVAAAPLLILLILILISLWKESKLLMIPAILLIFIATFAFALMVVGNIVWSEKTIYLIILFYFLFLAGEVVTIIFSLKSFKKPL